MQRLAVIVLVLAGSGPVLAQAGAPPAAPDKSQFTLFNPTPRDLWRPMSADRPDVTESPKTVDAGAVQLEISFFEYLHDSDNTSAEKTNSLLLAFTNVKVGLLNNVDLQIVFAPYVRDETRPDAGTATVSEGFSDVVVRLKVNFWGNDEGDTALGILPFIKIPTGTSLSNGRVEAGIALPFGWDISEKVGLGVMPQLDLVYNDSTGTHDLGLLFSTVLGFEIYGPVAGYAEYVGIAFFNGADDYESLLSFGGTYEITPNAVLDAGARVGLNRRANDLAVFMGITLRF